MGWGWPNNQGKRPEDQKTSDHIYPYILRHSYCQRILFRVHSQDICNLQTILYSIPNDARIRFDLFSISLSPVSITLRQDQAPSRFLETPVKTSQQKPTITYIVS